MTTTITRLPTRAEHSTSTIAGALSTLYSVPSTKVPSDATLRQIAQEVEAQFGLLSQQAQSDIYLARIRELSAR